MASAGAGVERSPLAELAARLVSTTFAMPLAGTVSEARPGPPLPGPAAFADPSTAALLGIRTPPSAASASGARRTSASESVEEEATTKESPAGRQAPPRATEALEVAERAEPVESIELV
jgi:hypothetical protein